MNRVQPENSIESLELEKLKHEEKASARKVKFRVMLEGKQIKLGFRKFAMDILITMIPCVTSIIPIALIPLHNILQYPEYWYEALIFRIPYLNCQGINTLMLASFYMNLTQPLRTRNLVIVLLISTIAGFILIALINHIWTQLLGFYPPIPLGGFAVGLPCLFLYLVTIWNSFPKVWRKTKGFKWRFMYFVFLLLYPSLIFKFQLQIIGGALKNSNGEKQVFVSLLLPCIRELNLWISSKLSKKVAEGDVTRANIILMFSLSAWYTIALCFILGSLASDATTWFLVGTDFTINNIIMLRIMWIRKRNPENIEQQIDLIQELAVYLLIEFVGPSVVILTFALLVYGSNCHLIGNLCNDYWQFSAIQDISQAFQNMGTFFIVDLLSIFTTVFTMKFCCGINILHVMMELLREFRYPFCAIIFTRIFAVSRLNFSSAFHHKNIN